MKDTVHETVMFWYKRGKAEVDDWVDQHVKVELVTEAELNDVVSKCGMFSIRYEYIGGLSELIGAIVTKMEGKTCHRYSNSLFDESVKTVVIETTNGFKLYTAKRNVVEPCSKGSRDAIVKYSTHPELVGKTCKTEGLIINNEYKIVLLMDDTYIVDGNCGESKLGVFRVHERNRNEKLIRDCSNLKEITIDLPDVGDTMVDGVERPLVENCSNLRKLTLNLKVLTNKANNQRLFSGCDNLKKLYLCGKATSEWLNGVVETNLDVLRCVPVIVIEKRLYERIRHDLTCELNWNVVGHIEVDY